MQTLNKHGSRGHVSKVCISYAHAATCAPALILMTATEPFSWWGHSGGAVTTRELMPELVLILGLRLGEGLGDALEPAAAAEAAVSGLAVAAGSVYCCWLAAGGCAAGGSLLGLQLNHLQMFQEINDTCSAGHKALQHKHYSTKKQLVPHPTPPAWQQPHAAPNICG
jgi:hypothetical protein